MPPSLVIKLGESRAKWKEASLKFQTTTRSLRELVCEFHTGTILLPQFQRDYVWKVKNILNLLDSLLNGFPIGGIYLWRPTGGALDAKPKGFGKNSIGPVFEGYLIDGQQRLTSLETAFGLFVGEDKSGKELCCYLDLAASDGQLSRDTRLFVSSSRNKSIERRLDKGDSTLIPISALFDGENYELLKRTEDSLRLIPGWDTNRVARAMRRLSQACTMLDQQIPCTTISDVKDNEAVEVFSRLNKGGKSLKQGDVRAAELARAHAVDVLKRMREFVLGEQPQRLGFGFSFAFRALVVFHRETAQFKTLKHDWIESPGPHGRSLSESWKVCELALGEALRFVDERMGWANRALLPSANAVIILAAALDKAECKITPNDEQSYRRWLCLTALRGVFQGSVETTINKFYRAIRDSKRDVPDRLLKALTKEEGRRLHSDDFQSYAQLWGAPTQVIHAWLVAQEATDWLNGELIDALTRGGGRSLAGCNLTVHHIFPRRVLADHAKNPDDANCPANYALLSQSTNSEFGDTPPDEVFAALPPAQRKHAAVQFFGEAAGDRLRSDRYYEFLEWRAARLAESINDWLGI